MANRKCRNRYHRWVNTDDPIAFLKCANCGIEHTTEFTLGKSKKCGKYCYRLNKDDAWKPYPTPTCPAPKSRSTKYKSHSIKVKVTEYNGLLVIKTEKPDEKLSGWVPIGPGKIGCVICDTKRNLGVSEEALKILETINRCHHDIGDIDWWACDDGTKAFAWIGLPSRMVDPKNSVGSKSYMVFRNDCTIIPNT